MTPPTIAAGIDEAEAAIRATLPSARAIYLEPDLDRLAPGPLNYFAWTHPRSGAPVGPTLRPNATLASSRVAGTTCVEVIPCRTP